MIHGPDSLSPWWKRSVILILSACFIVLIGISIKAYTDAPPIPEKVIDASGEILFTADDILSGQEVFLKYGLMQNGSIWGHGAYLGPDFSAEYLHTLATHAAESVAQQQYQRGLPQLQAGEKAIVYALVGQMLKENRYDARTGTLLFTSSETFSYQNQKEKWKSYFAETRQNRGLLNKAIQDPRELDRLTAFFAWTAWASVAKRSERDYHRCRSGSGMDSQRFQDQGSGARESDADKLLDE